MTRRSQAAVAALALAASVTACGDSVLVPEEHELTQTEALALAGQLGLQSFSFARRQDGGVPGQSPEGGPSLVPETVSISYSFRRPCALGGAVSSSGTVQVLSDADIEKVVVDVTATDIHEACVLRGDNELFTLDGDPDLTAQIHVASLEAEADGVQSVSLVGAVLWETDDRFGRCEVDFRVEVDPAAGTESTRGSFCGYEFDVSVSSG